ncbi:MAG: pyruvate formate lyase family protein [bacterium]
MLLDRLEILKEQLQDSAPIIWEEPFYETWIACEGLDERIRFAQSQAAEMSAVKPFIKPGELIIGNNALRSVLTGLPTPFRTGMRFESWQKEIILNEYPSAIHKINEIESFWNKWASENGQYTPMTCHASLAYEIILNMGIDGMKKYVKHWQDINTIARPECKPWYDALLIILDGISAFISAHAITAEKSASFSESKDELMKISTVCHNIAHNPPQSFHEAVQLFYLVFYLCGHDSPGPIDRYLYPFLKNDIENEKISYEEAQEIVDCLWLKFEEKTAYGATIGGQLRDGTDASNELSILCVNSIKKLRLLSPRTALRWHKGISDKLFDLACESIAEGATYPALVNDSAIIPAMVERGIKIEDSREYTFVGCGQTYPHGRGHGNYEDIVINSAKPLELALNNGIDPMTGNRLGPATGESSSFHTYEEFEKAYRQQMDYHISQHINSINKRREKIKDHAFDFLRSLLTHSCVERGLDWHAGGADYSEGMVDMVGLTTTTDSLLAIKYGVYKERKVTLAELVDILNKNWDGAEQLRLYFLHRMPKFGNDSYDADVFTANEVSRINEYIKSHKTYFGGPWGMDIIGWSGAVGFGMHTGATPDGRKRGEPLADCAGPAQGRNVLGLTPTLNSVLRLPHLKTHGPMALSLRFPPKSVQGEEGRANLRTIIETYFMQGGQQLQISIASTDDMKKAQKDPEAYRSLMVRVGGFSAYFTQLDKSFQDDMIARSELEL